MSLEHFHTQTHKHTSKKDTFLQKEVFFCFWINQTQVKDTGNLSNHNMKAEVQHDSKWSRFQKLRWKSSACCFFFPFLLLVRELHLLTFEVRSELLVLRLHQLRLPPHPTRVKRICRYRREGRSRAGGRGAPVPEFSARKHARTYAAFPQPLTRQCERRDRMLAMFWFVSFLTMSCFGFRPRRMIWGFVCFMSLAIKAYKQGNSATAA